MRLTELGKLHNTDKATYHGFTDVYEDYFKRYDEPTILEIGVYHGASIRMMDDYYDGKAKIFGFDNGDQLTYSSDKENIKIIKGHQRSEADLNRLLVECCHFDIIIDDASHFVEDQIYSFNKLFSYLNKGGIYIIEDLHSSFHPHYNPSGKIDTYEWLSKLKTDVYLEEYYIKQKNNIGKIDIFVTKRDGEELNNLSSITSVITRK